MKRDMRNIVLITFDSLRADHCSFMGYHRKTTPTLDKMARKGLYFENAIAAGTGTPSAMVGMFTGEFSCVGPGEIKPELWKKELSKRTTLAEILSKLGYTTGAFNPNAFVSSFFGFDKGFNRYYDFISGESKAYSKIFNKIFSENSKIFTMVRNIRNYIFKKEIFMPWDSYYTQIINWIENVKEPFFLWILILDTHHPYIVNKKFRKYSNLYRMLYSNWKLYKVHWKDELSEKEKKWLIDSYDDSISYADAFLKNFLKDTRNVDPVVIVHSDHGEAFGEHGFYGHQAYLYEEILHVPFVVYNIDFKDKIKEPVSLLNFFSFVLDFVKFRSDELALKNFLKSNKKWVIAETLEGNSRKIAVRVNNWKFIMNQKDVDELYNLGDDPYEQENVYYKYPKFVHEVKKIADIHLKQRIRVCKDRLVVRNLSNKKI